MTTEQIQKKQRVETTKFEVAVQIRKLLDEARAALSDDQDADEYESEIISLVSDDE